MQQPTYSTSYRFLRYRFNERRHTDNRAGICNHYFGYMRKGNGRLVSDTHTIEVKEGDLFYIPAGCRYQSYWSGEPEVCFDSLSFASFLQGGEGYLLQRIPFEAPPVRDAFFTLTDGEMQINHKTVGLFYLFLDAVLPFMQTRRISRARQTVDRAIAYMREAEELSVPLLARRCGVSESGLYAAFRAEEGTTPLAVWRGIQAHRAAYLLQMTDLPIEMIADRLGYCSATYFRAVFRREMGCSPRQIRQQKTI